jgi:SpoIIAA-like
LPERTAQGHAAKTGASAALEKEEKMLTVNMDDKRGIAVLEPLGALSKEDFERAAKVIDPTIEKTGRLNGLIIHTKDFPGWDSFGAFASHLKFVKEHHKKVKRIALCTDSIVSNLAKLLGPHFINAEIRVFPYNEFESAGKWVAEPGS